MTAVDTSAGANPAAGRGGKVDGYALFWGMPLALWQATFFWRPSASSS